MEIEKIPLLKIMNDDFVLDNATLLVCPECKLEFNHIKEVTAEKDDVYEFDDCGYRASWEGRGGLVTILMQCECDWLWTICVGFHKGNTVIFAQSLGIK